MLPTMAEGPDEAKPANIPKQIEAEEGATPADEAKPRRRASGDTRVHRFNLVAVGEEAKHFDFLAARPRKNRITELEAMVHMIKKSLGAGVMVIHQSYITCGLWTALILNIITGFLTVHCMYMLSKSAQIAYGRTQVPYMTYPDLAEAAFDIGPFPTLRKYSRIFRYLVEGSLVIRYFGTCAIYQVTMAYNINWIFEGSTHVSDNKARIYIALILIPCILLCLIRTLKYLAPFSMITDVFMFLIAISTVFYGTLKAKNPFDFPIFHSAAGVLAFIPACALSLEADGLVQVIENSLARPDKVFKVLHIAMLYVLATVIVVGFFGYLGFGEKAKAPITLNFPWSGLTMNLCVYVVLILNASFAIAFFIAFDLIWFYLKRRHDPEKYSYFERIYRSLFVTAITLISIALPSIILDYLPALINVIGPGPSFIFPAIIELCIIYEDPGLGAFNWRLWKIFGVIIFGLSLVVFGAISKKNLILIQ